VVAVGDEEPSTDEREDALDLGRIVYRPEPALNTVELGLEPGPALRDLEHAILSADPSLDPGIGAKPIVPRPGQAIGIHSVVADSLAARVDGNTIVVTARWTSGVEPCTILDSIVVDKGEGTYTITLREGSSPQEIACIAIAEQHVTEFEIPDVAAGTWTITDSGGVATPVQVTVG